jgi:glycosyltransferase involved in cell wall biosynthesis
LDHRPLTVIVPTLNEEEMLPACLESVRFADEILVVDSFSTDRTGAIARAAGARFLQNRFVDFSTQKNWAIARAAHEWILQVDADERVTPALRDEIETLLKEGPGRAAYRIPRRNYFLDRPMRHTGWGRDAVVRLFRRDARFRGEVHETLVVDGPIGDLRGILEHRTFRSFAQYWGKMLSYSALGAARLHREGRRAGPAQVTLRPLAYFVKMYVVRLGFLDGMHGLVLSLLGAATVYFKYARLWEMGLAGRTADAPGGGGSA